MSEQTLEEMFGMPKVWQGKQTIKKQERIPESRHLSKDLEIHLEVIDITCNNCGRSHEGLKYTSVFIKREIKKRGKKSIQYDPLDRLTPAMHNLPKVINRSKATIALCEKCF